MTGHSRNGFGGQMITLRLFILVVGLWPLWSWSASLYPSEWDSEFKDAAIFMPAGTDWRMLKAQCYQESRLRPFARSPVGAMGLCQFMPGTWRDMQRRRPGLTSAWIPEQSILAAGVYMGQLARGWSSKRTRESRHKLALASYNAGMGNLIKAQRRCGGPVEYDAIVECLPGVTGRHSVETTGYVRQIYNRWYPAMALE